jgi:hypothetical protein
MVTKDENKNKDKEVIKEIHKTPMAQGRMFQIENRHAKVILTSNFDEDRFPNMAAIGVRLIDHLAGTKKILDNDDQDHV